MVLHYSDDLLKTPDPNGGQFGDWIFKKDTFNVTCRLCKSNVCIKEGEKALAKHSSSAKHHKAKGAQAGTGNMFQAFAQQDVKQREQKSYEEKARDAELIYLHHIEAHGIPPHVASCTTLLFKQMFLDSKIAEKFTFSDSKQGYEITHVLGQHYNTRLVNRLQQEYFSINIGAWIDHLDSFKNPNPLHSKVGFLKVVCYKHWVPSPFLVAACKGEHWQHLSYHASSVFTWRTLLPLLWMQSS
ncbi:hypothetical protein NP493_206g01019 [Ridgeia piscesae]|uniref:Uncharacterized protein n=1 Tax=Ridgeia piscesae TaxID=27915 RepID=A0AAD9UEG6_RIDPI|nr:hypothetical protein NP493_206g01019 [Ridgeia piscesae]